jgi:hypothetical protein
MMPQYYQKILASKLDLKTFHFLQMVLAVLSTLRNVKLEALAHAISMPIQANSRRKRLQRFLDLPCWDLEFIWFPLVLAWLENEVKPGEELFVILDRTNWKGVNLMVVSVAWNRRAFPLYWELLDKAGSSNLSEQQQALTPVIWPRDYAGFHSEEPWILLTNLGEQKSALRAYAKRFRIEEMFRDWKGGGYCLESAKVRGQRLLNLVLLIAIAYTTATLQGLRYSSQGIQSYVSRTDTEPGRHYLRHSYFYMGSFGATWAQAGVISNTISEPC